MTDWPAISSGRKIRPSHITGLQDAVDGIQTGALPIVPLEHMRAGVVNVLDDGEVDPTGGTDNTEAIQAKINEVADLVASLGWTHGGVVIVPPGKYAVSQQIVVPDWVTVQGVGQQASVLFATDDFPENTPLVRMGSGASTTERAFLRDLYLWCRDIPGSSGVFSETVQEPSGLFGVVIAQYKNYGVWIEDQSGGAANVPAAFTMDHCQLFASGDGALAGVRLINTLNTSVISRTTIGSWAHDESNSVVGIEATGSPLVLNGVHFEFCDNGTEVTKGANNAGSATIIAPTGHNSITGALVHVTDSAPHVIINAFGNGSADIVKDDVSGYSTMAASAEHTEMFWTNRPSRMPTVVSGILEIDHTVFSLGTTIADTVLADSSGDAVYFSLTENQYVQPGTRLTIKRNGGNLVRVFASGTDQLDGHDYWTISTDKGFLTMVADGTNWQIVGSGGTVTGGDS